MKREDLAVALSALGNYIGRIDDCPTNAVELTYLKHAYLRINHYLVKTSTCSPQEFRATIRALRGLPANSVLSPGWLPCHKLPIQHHLLPCIRPDDVCHCAKLLQCDADEEDDFFSLFKLSIEKGGLPKA